MMLLKLYLMFYSKWFLEKIGDQGTGEHGQVLVHLLTLFFLPLSSSTSSPSPSLHCASSPPYPLLPPTVLVHLSLSSHCARSPPHPLHPSTVLVHLLTLFILPLCSFTSSPSSSPHCARSPPHPLHPSTVLVHLLALFFLPLFQSSTICWLLMRTRADMLSVYLGSVRARVERFFSSGEKYQ